MNPTDLNDMLMLILILAALLGAAFWFSPKGCRWISLYLFCRAEALDAKAETFAATMRANVEDMG